MAWPPEPPVELPPGRIVHVRGVGELFVRDTGGERPPLLLLHGWMFAADSNWWPVYRTLEEAGYRVIALDHRGHGRGLRMPERFRLLDCARDAAALLDALDTGPVVAVGYSMGGPIAQLLARERPDLVRGLVLCATAPDWQDPHLKLFWRSMALLRLTLGLFPTAAWQASLRGMRPGPYRTWLAAELSRGSARDIAEAGRELGRYDARPWLRELDVPAAVVVTTRDTNVPPRKQRQLAELLGAATFEVPGSHLAVATHKRQYREALLAALRAVEARASAPARTAAA
jgi:pimeloyl-ACP methyl ester carboxylesterase